MLQCIRIIFIICFQGQENFCLTAEEKLSDLVRSDGLSSVSTPALQTGTPASTTDRRQDTKTSVSSSGTVQYIYCHNYFKLMKN